MAPADFSRDGRSRMSEILQAIVSGFYALHRDVHQALSAAVASPDGNAKLDYAALALGALHAVTPGHGKAILVSYFLGREAKPLAGVAASMKIAAGHVLLAAILVALFGSAVSFMGRPAGAAAAVETAAYAVIAAMGAWLLIRAVRRPSMPESAHAAGGHDAPAAAALIPCPLTMLLLTYALANASLAVVAVLLAAFAAGIGLTLSAVAVAAIAARRVLAVPLAALPAWHAPALRILEAASAAVILAVGLAFLVPRLMP
jgi:ABC-type nickel/cobalt efflux system permease component RcnA